MAGLLVLGNPRLASAQAEQVVPVACMMPIHVSCNVTETARNRSTEPQITLHGAITLGGLGADLSFQNDVEGNHPARVTTLATNVSLVPVGGNINVPKQPVLEGMGGNPYIYMQFLSGKRNPLTDEVLLGRSAQGLSFEGDFLNHVAGPIRVGTDGRRNHSGSIISLEGKLVLSGLKARFIFRNDVKGAHTAEKFSDVDIISDGTPIMISQSARQGGAGGNPLIVLQFLQGDGAAIGAPVTLGRLKKI